MDDDEVCPSCDGYLEAEFEERNSGIGIDTHEEDGGETDPDLEVWLAARAVDWEEQRWALADQEAEQW